jgi:malate synthase
MAATTSFFSVPKAFWTEREQCLFPQSLINLLIDLHHEFEPRRKALLCARALRQETFNLGELPNYLSKDSVAVQGDWRVADIPSCLRDRRVEITGPVNSIKMVINMLSRNEFGDRADMAMLDFEDSMKPSFKNVLDGYENVIQAVEGKLEFQTDQKLYKIDKDDSAYVMVRCRGLHLDESNVLVGGEPISAGLLDLVTCFFHTADTYLAQGKVPKYYVPKCEHYLEARWWNDLFTRLEETLDVPIGTLRATFLIETLPAAFQIEEILYEIRHHAAGLNVGRWDKIFSDIKVLREHSDRILADRSNITMSKPWMENYAKRVIKICHERGAFAMGGMSAFTPGKSQEDREQQAEKVKEDKRREAEWGHDGCWVSHPYFIGIARESFKLPHQLAVTLPEFNRYPDLLPKDAGPKTLDGLRKNIRVGISYLHGWRRDIGCVAVDHLMEDLATLEISRAQSWQWFHHGIALDDGSFVDQELIHKILLEEKEKIFKEFPKEEKPFIEAAAEEVFSLYTAKDLREFLVSSSELVSNDFISIQRSQKGEDDARSAEFDTFMGYRSEMERSQTRL